MIHQYSLFRTLRRKYHGQESSYNGQVQFTVTGKQPEEGQSAKSSPIKQLRNLSEESKQPQRRTSYMRFNNKINLSKLPPTLVYSSGNKSFVNDVPATVYKNTPEQKKGFRYKNKYECVQRRCVPIVRTCCKNLFSVNKISRCKMTSRYLGGNSIHRFVSPVIARTRKTLLIRHF